MSISGIGRQIYSYFTPEEPGRLGLVEMLEQDMEGQEPDFVGISVLISKQAAQLREFESWAKEGRWEEFSHQHYDWWMFPIDRRSRGYGGMYTVHENQVKALQRRPRFMDNYKRGVALLLYSWGWHPSRNQLFVNRFDNNLVRLGKVLQSLDLFGEKQLFESAQEFAKQVMDVKHLSGDWTYLRTLIWKLPKD